MSSGAVKAPLVYYQTLFPQTLLPTMATMLRMIPRFARIV